ncbi:hypothetical protein Theam_0364 [Thermovibrio ammonificans HB-1]|uniref:Uncharacterized protein n=1 Tax=Thermovibrio ammonificans (strain DSM 15698 / JCM 12110 / HB-1) TaxID=648996 RepID=E8T4S5_THEA1|nr:hypothetical protein Theam_0364 [Thermovibrio ammonificans HB-1]
MELWVPLVVGAVGIWLVLRLKDGKECSGDSCSLSQVSPDELDKCNSCNSRRFRP